MTDNTHTYEGYRSVLEDGTWPEDFIHNSYFHNIIEGLMPDYSTKLLRYIVTVHCPKHGISVPDVIRVIVEMGTNE